MKAVVLSLLRQYLQHEIQFNEGENLHQNLPQSTIVGGAGAFDNFDFSGLDKNRNLSLPIGQPAIQFDLPEAVLNKPKVQSSQTCHENSRPH